MEPPKDYFGEFNKIIAFTTWTWYTLINKVNGVINE
jgi:hypothetical protein